MNEDAASVLQRDTSPRRTRESLLGGRSSVTARGSSRERALAEIDKASPERKQDASRPSVNERRNPASQDAEILRSWTGSKKEQLPTATGSRRTCARHRPGEMVPQRNPSARARTVVKRRRSRKAHAASVQEPVAPSAASGDGTGRLNGTPGHGGGEEARERSAVGTAAPPQRALAAAELRQPANFPSSPSPSGSSTYARRRARRDGISAFPRPHRRSPGRPVETDGGGRLALELVRREAAESGQDPACRLAARRSSSGSRPQASRGNSVRDRSAPTGSAEGVAHGRRQGVEAAVRRRLGWQTTGHLKPAVVENAPGAAADGQTARRSARPRRASGWVKTYGA